MRGAVLLGIVLAACGGQVAAYSASLQACIDHAATVGDSGAEHMAEYRSCADEVDRRFGVGDAGGDAGGDR